MAEPETIQEYYKLVQAQSFANDEHVASHSELQQQYQHTRQYYEQQRKVYSFLLLLLLLAWAAFRFLLPDPTPADA